MSVKTVFRALTSFYGEGGQHINAGEEISPDQWNALSSKDKGYFNAAVVPDVPPPPATIPAPAAEEQQAAASGSEAVAGANEGSAAGSAQGVGEGSEAETTKTTGNPPPQETHETIGQHIADFWKKLEGEFEAFKASMEGKVKSLFEK